MRIVFLFALIVNLLANSGGAYHGSEPFVKGQILVKVDPNYALGALRSVEHAVGAKMIRQFPLIEGLNLYQFDPDLDVHEVIKSFLSHDAVLYAEPDYIYGIDTAKEISVNDPDFSKQWALENKGQNGGVADVDINAESAWSYQKGSRNITIGIIDTGIDYRHQDLLENLWSNTLEIPGNGKDDDQNGYIDDIHGINAIRKNGDPLDDHLHGTHVAGIIGAKGNNALGISGVAQSVELAACKFLSAAGFGGISDAIACMDYFASLKSRAQNPVNLVATNNSWGGGSRSQAMFDAIKAHERLGILFIAAAGNNSSDNDVIDTYPANYQVRNVISVAATDSSDRLASFSNFGKKTVHVAAPGVKILSTLINNKYGELSGTSMATPHVSGLAALIAAQHPDIGYRGIKNLIMTGGQIVDGAQKTSSGRRIRGADRAGVGSLSCEDQILTVREQPAVANQRVLLGQSLFLSALSLNCARPHGPLTLLDSPDGNVVLSDKGEHGDVVADDGVFSLNWTPLKEGVYQLKFTPTDTVSITVYKNATEN